MSRYRFNSVRQKVSPGLYETVLGGMLLEHRRADSEENKQKVRDHINQKVEGQWSNENIKFAIEYLGNDLELAVVKQKVLPRIVDADEMLSMFQQIHNANKSWLADTERNWQIIADEFTSDRTPPTRNLMAMKNAVQRVSAQLERVPPPPPPEFKDEDLTVKLADGSTKLPLNVNAMHQSQTRLQRLNLIERLRKKEAWDADHQ